MRSKHGKNKAGKTTHVKATPTCNGAEGKSFEHKRGKKKKKLYCGSFGRFFNLTNGA